MIVRSLYLSPGHNYFGRHGQEPGAHPVHEVEEMECVAGHGIRGDRFFDYKPATTARSRFSRAKSSPRSAAHSPPAPSRRASRAAT